MARASTGNVDIAMHGGKREVIAVAVPSFGMVHLLFAGRMLNLVTPLNRILRWFFVVGKEVGNARNEAAARALAIGESDPTETCSHLLFLDDDVLFHPEVLLKLLQHDLPLVSGLYYAKSGVPQPLVLHDEFGGLSRQWTPGDLVPCAGHGMGISLIRTEVLRRVRDELPVGTDKFGYPDLFETVKDRALVRPDGTPVVYNCTEDWNFLQKARQLGYQPVVDTSEQAFGWHMDTRTMRAFPEKQWREFTERGTVTWETDASGETSRVVWGAAA